MMLPLQPMYFLCALCVNLNPAMGQTVQLCSQEVARYFFPLFEYFNLIFKKLFLKFLFKSYATVIIVGYLIYAQSLLNA